MNRITSHPVANPPVHERNVQFFFDGQPLSGFEGEAVSSALFANNIREFSHHNKDGAPQGIFCANGQCSQCTVLIDGIPKKSCITPLKAGMDVRTLKGLPKLPELSAYELTQGNPELSCDILVVGGGPSGLAAALELGERGFNVIIADDKDRLGGKLVLQTHKFFGSEEDCYAGTRGYEIAEILENKLKHNPHVRILTNSPIVGLYKDKKAGVYLHYKAYGLIDFQALVIAAGARERSLVFPGNDLPGVYGAGAFQTLVNRDFIKAAKRVFVIGSGNVGLIGSYHALQAGIEVAGICEILPKVNGYKVHADKIVRMGVPVYLNHTVLCVEGNGKVERITIAQADKDWRPLLETARTFEVDTVLVATGLSPCDELYSQAITFGFTAVKAGDAEEIAEASSAIFGGKIAALALAKMLGQNVSIDAAWLEKREVLKSRPGAIISRQPVTPGKEWQPVFFCTEEIPCNPCTTVCPTKSINLKPIHGSIMDLPYFTGNTCKGCTACVAACPGLAVSLIREIDKEWSEVQLPCEFSTDSFTAGTLLPVLDQDGNFLENAELLKKFYNKKYKTSVLTLKISSKNAPKAIGIRVQQETATQSLPEPKYSYIPDNAIVCRCERVTVREIKEFIQTHAITDINQLKTIRVGMGACGSKTCSVLLPQIFKQCGIDPAQVAKGTQRPLVMEVTIGDIVSTETAYTAHDTGVNS